MSAMPSYSSQLSDTDLIESTNTYKIPDETPQLDAAVAPRLPVELEYWRDSTMSPHGEWSFLNNTFGLEEILYERNLTPLPCQRTGFTTASNRKIDISADSLKKAKLLLDDDVFDSPILLPLATEQQTTAPSENVPSLFKTASNKPISISLTSLAKVNDVLFNSEYPAWTEERSNTIQASLVGHQTIHPNKKMPLPLDEGSSKSALSFPNTTKTKILAKASTASSSR